MTFPQISQRGPARGPVTSFLFLRYHLQSFKVGGDILDQDEMIVVI